jgi:poly(hydroxyalkanoate) depolymerase family esterase
MPIPLHQKLLRAAGLSGTPGLVPTRLAELATQLQRGLGLPARPGETPPAPPASPILGTQAILVRGANLLERVQTLTVGRPAADSKTASSPMLARTFSADADSRSYRLFVPNKLPPSPSLIVMLHGCSQSPEDFAAGTRMNDLAGPHGFLVLYPEQTSSANLQRCWNWFNPADQQRDQGEPSLIAGMTRAVIAEFGVDPARVFVAGLSAGGAEAAILGATYPELYTAIGIHSGLACGAAHDMASAFAAMRQGKPGNGTISRPAIIFHGDRDSTVNLANANALAAQLGNADDAHTEHGEIPGGLAYTRLVRPAYANHPQMEQWTIHGAGHAWSGGSSAGSFTDPKGPDASAEMLRFFLAAAGAQAGSKKGGGGGGGGGPRPPRAPGPGGRSGCI